LVPLTYVGGDKKKRSKKKSPHANPKQVFFRTDNYTALAMDAARVGE
jgi:hypothetical protein